jgi:hypothetical protein
MSEEPLTKAERLAVAKAMSRFGRKGGSQKSDKKADACRKNGQLGGRRPAALRLAEEGAYNALCDAVKAGASVGKVRALVAKWVRTADKYTGVVRAKWTPEYGDIADFLAE